MSYHNTSSSSRTPSTRSTSGRARQSVMNNQERVAPPGFHYMPDGSLMSDIEHARLYSAPVDKTITGFNFNTNNIVAAGETRSFTITGSAGATFTLEVKNEDDYYYNFRTNLFQAAEYKLLEQTIQGGSFNTSIVFPAVTDADKYDFVLFAENGTNHNVFQEVRFADGTIDINSSTGSSSLIINKVLYQTLDTTLILSTISPNSVTAFASHVPSTQTITTQVGKSVRKTSFEISVTSGSTKAFKIDRQPTASDIAVYVSRVIGSAPLAIPGEDISSSTYYRWPINNLDGLDEDMLVIGTNVTAGSVIKYYEDTYAAWGSMREATTTVSKRYEALDTKSVPPTLTRNATSNSLQTTQTGDIIFDRQQAAALADDTISVYAYGYENIKTLTGWEIELDNLAVTVTKPTTTTTQATVNLTTVTVASGDGIMDDVSTVSGIGIDPYAVNPTVTNIGSYSGTTATLTFGAAQTLEKGTTLTFDGAGETITITGNITINNVGKSHGTNNSMTDWDGKLYFDLEKFITATVEAS